MKIVHISDIHILNYRFHDEYRQVFQKLYDQIDKIKPDLIINTGDTAHTKLAISPTWVEVTAEFFTNLANRAPLWVIPGNHDLNAKSPEKTDAVSPVVNLLSGRTTNPIRFFRESQVVTHNDIDFYVLSFLEPEKWPEPIDPSRTSVALYHGGVKGAKTDAGWVIAHGEITMSTLRKYDYALLGDIHHCQKLDEHGKIRYAGNLVQFNFGESNDKGFLSWDIRGKDDFDCEKIVLKNPKPFETVYVDQNGDCKNTLPPNARVRISYDSRLPTNKLKNFTDTLKKKYKPESVVAVPRFVDDNSETSEIRERISLNLRSLSAQEELIRDYVKNLDLSEEQIRRLIELNSQVDATVMSEDVMVKASRWELEKMEWSNLFSFGEDNYIDFKNLNGIIGQFSNNGEGKSATWDALCLCIFNTTAKNEKKNLNVINTKKDNASCKVTARIGDSRYVIERKFQKYSKTKEAIEAKVDVDFRKINEDGTEEILNGETRTDTDKNIRAVFGTVDDFLLTSYSTQFDSFRFVSENWSKRKEVLGRFLDLDSFEKKFKYVKDLASEHKAFLKKCEKTDFAVDISREEKNLHKILSEIDENRKVCATLTEKKATLTEELLGLKVAAGTTKVRDAEEIEENLYKVRCEISDATTSLEKSLAKLSDLTTELSEMQTKLTGLSSATEELKNLMEKRNQSDALEAKAVSKEPMIRKLDGDAKILKEVPCEDKFPTCKFIVEATKAAQIAKDLREETATLRKERDNLLEKLTGLDEAKRRVDEYKTVNEKINKLTREIAQNTVEKERKSAELSELGKKLEMFEKELKESKDAGDIGRLFKKISQLTDDIAKLDSDLAKCDGKSTKLYVDSGIAQNTLETLWKKKAEVDRYAEEYSLYEIYLRCLHPNGIPFEIIKKNLPAINNEIATILANCADFQVFLDVDEKQLNILYSKNGEDPIIIEMSSGAEKTLASFAIRLALISITHLPVPDVMILDEPATSFDDEKLEGFTSTLEMIKSKFRNVILISHIHGLKDIANQFIAMSKVNGFASIQQS